MTTSTPTAVHVNLITRESTVRQRLTTVLGILVRIMELVRMESSHSHVIVLLDLLEPIVKQTWMNVRAAHVRTMAHVVMV